MKKNYVMHHESIDEEPVSNFVSSLIQNAINKHASDIHIEPHVTDYRIRLRCDGLLHEMTRLSHHFGLRIISRLKVLASLDIAERRMPQDGRLYLNIFSETEIRISTCPTLFGEKLVLRLLNKTITELKIESLGLSKAQHTLFLNILNQPQGLILVTGPTGSGKTTTLYAALSYLNKIEKNIISIEDPIEMSLEGVNQINVQKNIQLHFSDLLRTILRQDPDIIMIGEIRDKETAQIALEAAQTGHLVLSTLHTNNAVDTIYRLRSLGILDYYFLNSIVCIMAQRLIRTYCLFCKNTLIAECHCQGGFKGRSGIFECIPLSLELTELILSGATSRILQTQIKNEGHTLLWEAGLEKIKNGLTSHAELVRILGKF